MEFDSSTSQEEDKLPALKESEADIGIEKMDVDKGKICADDNEGTEGAVGYSFDVLDEVDADEDTDENVYQKSDSEGGYDSNVPDEEIEAMLEEGLPQEFKVRRKRQEEKIEGVEYIIKTVVEDLSTPDHFNILPDGWVQATHTSGIPIFLHRQLRVCSLARPYYLGQTSLHKHDIPSSAIPCLNYRKAKENEAKRKEQEEIEGKQPNVNGFGIPIAIIETAQENRSAHTLSSQEVQDYCLKLFNFKTIKIKRYDSWAARRKSNKEENVTKQFYCPTLPEGTQLIQFPVASESVSHSRKEWMNPNGKSYVCILHEYIQHALKKQPSYIFKELDSAATPYTATVNIDNMQYGIGFGMSKRQAKYDAAAATLEILIPAMKVKIEEDRKNGYRTIRDHEPDFTFFDEIKIEDPRIAEYCEKTTEPSPYAVLLTCLHRNFGLNELKVNYEVKNNVNNHKKNEYIMTVGKHTVRKFCKNRKEGKMLTSQAVLQLLHPHISSWGSLLRLYGQSSVKNIKEKKEKEQEITHLQNKASANCPNNAILNKLRDEMIVADRKKVETLQDNTLYSVM